MEILNKKRQPTLPKGWHPQKGADIEESVFQWVQGCKEQNAMACISPHAGWAFSGRISTQAIFSLAKSQTIAIVGGHLPYNAPILYGAENRFDTPNGEILLDEELLRALENELKEAGLPSMVRDDYTDNSVEVLLPMIAVLHPGSRILWLRAPSRMVAKELGAALGRASALLGRSVTCIGSTDLTHYGPSYGFTPYGTGEKAEKWVRGVNDKAFINALLDMNCEAALAHGVKKSSSCSPGAAISALSYAIERGATQARVLEYSTSLGISSRTDSFVGYAAIAFT
jgi:AmmeMemoRadiSam system protein B